MKATCWDVRRPDLAPGHMPCMRRHVWGRERHQELLCSKTALQNEADSDPKGKVRFDKMTILGVIESNLCQIQGRTPSPSETFKVSRKGAAHHSLNLDYQSTSNLTHSAPCSLLQCPQHLRTSSPPAPCIILFLPKPHLAIFRLHSPLIFNLVFPQRTLGATLPPLGPTSYPLLHGAASLSQAPG